MPALWDSGKLGGQLKMRVKLVSVGWDSFPTQSKQLGIGFLEPAMVVT